MLWSLGTWGEVVVARSVNYPHATIEHVARSTQARSESVRENARTMRGIGLPSSALGPLAEGTVGRSNSTISAMSDGIDANATRLQEHATTLNQNSAAMGEVDQRYAGVFRSMQPEAPSIELRQGRVGATTRMLSTGTGNGVDPNPESIRYGTVRMEDHPDFAATIADARSKGFDVVDIPPNEDARVVVRRVVGPNGETIREERELRIRPGMRYLDLEHEVGHINQVTDQNRFPDGPMPTDIVTETPRGYRNARNPVGILTTKKNAVLEYHNRLQEVVWLDQRGAPPDLMTEHLEGVYGIRGSRDGGWRESYQNAMRSSTEQAWAGEHFPDMQDLEAQVSQIRRRVYTAE